MSKTYLEMGGICETVFKWIGALNIDNDVIGVSDDDTSLCSRVYSARWVYQNQ